MALYDKYYIKPEYFGKPYPELVEFFDGCDRGSVCDLGAGQGRNSLPLSKMGFDVTAVDISGVGLRQIEELDSSITTLKQDIEGFDVSEFDYVLFDSMLHFYSRDLRKEKGIVEGILCGMKRGAVFVNCMMKSDKAERILKKLIAESDFELAVVLENYLRYEEADSDYHMLTVMKI